MGENIAKMGLAQLPRVLVKLLSTLYFIEVPEQFCLTTQASGTLYYKCLPKGTPSNIC